MPCAASRMKMSFRLWPLDTSISSVRSSTRVTPKPGSEGAVDSGSRRLSTKVSVCSLRSTLLIRSFSMIRPLSMMATLRQRFSASSR